jgi:hypothetical protein
MIQMLLTRHNSDNSQTIEPVLKNYTDNQFSTQLNDSNNLDL